MMPTDPSTRDSSSIAVTYSTYPMPEPPYSTGKIVPSSPSLPSSFTVSSGNSLASSHFMTLGAISRSANSRTIFFNCSCSSESWKSTGPSPCRASATLLARLRRAVETSDYDTGVGTKKPQRHKHLRCTLHDEVIDMDYTNRRLMWHGMCLFLLGLLTGFVESRFTNVRMGLAAHLEGVMNGIFLLALGAIWTSVRLSPRAKTIAFWIVLYGTYGNWLATTLAAIFGTAALFPITGAGTKLEE